MDPHVDFDHNDEADDVEKQLGQFDGKEKKDEHDRFSINIPDRSTPISQPFQRNRTNTTAQTAVVGANVCPIESLDYEIIENELFMQDWRSRKRVRIFQYVLLKWGLALLIGLITGLVGMFNNITVENIAGFKLLLTSNLMLKGDNMYIAKMLGAVVAVLENLILVLRYLKAFLAFTGCNIGLATVAGSLCAFIAPSAAGSGIPEVKAYLNGVDAPSILAPATLFVKILGSILGVSSGLVVGKQGPLVHTGACIASLLGQGGSRNYTLTWRPFRYFKNDRDQRDLITCGAAAGVTAAFRAPIGGVLFSLEEAASWWRNALLWRAFFTTAAVALVLRSFIEYCWTGQCGLFGNGGLIMFDVSAAVATYDGYDLLAVIFLGVIGGVLGSLFNYFVDHVLRIYRIINKKGPTFRILLVIFISVLTTCCAFGLPWFTKCTPCPTNLSEECPTVGESGNYKSFQCGPGHYNDLASLFLNTSDNAIRNLLSTRTTGEYRISSLFIFFITVYTLGIITYGIAVPAGLFVPVILAGAVCGRLVGRLFDSVSGLDTGLFSLLGAAALLGGTMRTPVSICVILLELSNNLLLLPLLMMVLLISKTVADFFNEGVCDQIVKLRGFPFMEANPEPYMKHLMAGDVVSRPVITFFGVEKVVTIVDILRCTRHNGFPVIDEPPFSDAPKLCGLVLRSHLLVLLKAKCFMKERVLSGIDMAEKFSPFDFAKPGLGKELKLDEIPITEEEMEMYIDLHPITNTSPYTLVETMSLAKAHILFRQLGLRHVCVVPTSQEGSPIIGILTRHDFIPEHILGLYPHIKGYK